MIRQRSDSLRVLFCHGLGCARRDVLAQRIRRWAASRKLEFQSIEYGNYGRSDQIWSVNDWSADVRAEIARQNQPRTLLVCNSAAGQAPSNLQGGATSLEGILMISPGVGLELENYMERVAPGSVEKLRSGEIIEHPSADPDVQIRVDLACLQEFVDVYMLQNCVLRRYKSIPISCPVRVVHGMQDKLVPYTNSLQLMQKIQSPDKALYLINEGHSITDQVMISHLLDSLCHRNVVGETPEKKGGESTPPSDDSNHVVGPNWRSRGSDERSSEAMALRHS